MKSSAGGSGRIMKLLTRLGQPMALPAPAPLPHALKPRDQKKR